MGKFLILVFLFFLFVIPYLKPAYAVVDPLAVPNNKFGIHIIQATHDESSPAASLVNSSGGDWGYVTVLIEGKDKKKDKWQEFFNDLRRRHLIPLVRLATYPDGNVWKIPDIGEAQVWADFLDSLNWPTKNRYVIIYNEPNQANEWGGSVDARSYAQTLDKTIIALKKKNADFFVLNAGFDASAPEQLPNYEDEVSFLQEMKKWVPGIFDKLDGWVSHSYPNPGFVGSPDASGRGTIRTYLWEMEQLRSLGFSKSLPIFITETGWKHAEGLNYDPSLPTSETLSTYYQNAFNNAWQDRKIVAVNPFLLNYQEKPFDHFSFKRVQETNPVSEYYPQFQAISGLPKVSGRPVQDNLARLIKGEVYSSIVAGESYQISLSFKNTGQSIWNDQDTTYLVPLLGGSELGIEKVAIPKEIKVEPGGEYTFKINLKAPQRGSFEISLNLFSNTKQFDSPVVQFNTEVKLPVILQVLTSLKWKDNAAGEYILRVSGVVGDVTKKVTLDNKGLSQELEARYLLPGYAFDFTLEKPFYHPKTIHKSVQAGVNTLDFGVLQPNLMQALLHPKEFWQLLPFSK